MAKQTRLHEHHKRPGKPPDEPKETYTPPREELGTSDEVVLQGDVYYATEKVPHWPKPDAARQYIATPEGMQDLQHGVVTWIDAAESAPDIEDVAREHEPGHKKVTTKPPEYDL